MLDADATVAVLSENPRGTALLLDFDGTLAPIVAVPEDAVAHPEALGLLERLARRLGLVAIVSGRPLEFLAARADVPGVALAGLYGLETREPDGSRRVDPRAAPYLDAVAAATAELEARLPGIVVERKAGVTVTVHWRRASGRAAEVREVASEIGARTGLDVMEGRMSVELRPPVPVDKGTAAAALVDGYAVAAFAGDDTGDIAAFEALARAAGDGRLARAVRIGVDSPEAPADLAAHVDVVVDGPEGVIALLRTLLAGVGDEVG